MENIFYRRTAVFYGDSCSICYAKYAKSVVILSVGHIWTFLSKLDYWSFKKQKDLFWDILVRTEI